MQFNFMLFIMLNSTEFLSLYYIQHLFYPIFPLSAFYPDLVVQQCASRRIVNLKYIYG